MEIHIRRISEVVDLYKVADLERMVWGMEPIPIHQTLTAAKNGGVVLGAFYKDEIVGFLYSFAGFQNGEVYLCSHMMGIHPAFRNQGLGYRLKLKQAEEAAKIGYQKIRWTYDPLESRNANLNIAKLGAICCEYIEDCYGEMDGELNKGLPTDRFNVEWNIHTWRIKRHKIENTKLVIDQSNTLINWRLIDGCPVVEKESGKIKEHSSPFLFVPVPTHFQEIKKNHPDKALEWRLKTREVFKKAFQNNWFVVHVIAASGKSVQYYVLVKRSFFDETSEK